MIEEWNGIGLGFSLTDGAGFWSCFLSQAGFMPPILCQTGLLVSETLPEKKFPWFLSVHGHDFLPEAEAKQAGDTDFFICKLFTPFWPCSIEWKQNKITLESNLNCAYYTDARAFL